MPATLNLIGPGRLGRTLARLWHDAGLTTLRGVAARDLHHAQAAVDFIGAGQAMPSEALPHAQFTLIAVPDDAIADVAQNLAVRDTPVGEVVFHCSGSLSSTALAPLAERGALVASIHPLKSFADPTRAIADFAGTYCACEGDAQALASLAPLFDAIGAHRFALDPQGKTLYHASAVLACNNLVALMETALRSMNAAGVDRPTAWQALRPLIDGTLANLDNLSTQDALTGPVARGDTATVARHLAALQSQDPAVLAVYRSLGQVALQLARLNDTRRTALATLLESGA